MQAAAKIASSPFASAIQRVRPGSVFEAVTHVQSTVAGGLCLGGGRRCGVGRLR